MSRVLAALILLAGFGAAVVIALTGPSATRPALSHQVESLFQDDDHLIYASTATVSQTLDTLASLGVQRIRATVLWRDIAPDPTSARAPAGFDPTNPADYPAASWMPYDRLVELAAARGIGVDFNVGAPGPRWGMGTGAPNARFATHWYPSAPRFGRFVTALGRRYSGAYTGAAGRPVPRVSYWSIWNEPNQPGWLAPQWRGSQRVAPVLYRRYLNAAFAALTATGHGPGRDTILIGELAPEGAESPAHSYREPMPPMPFLRALYCVDQGYRPLTGAAAKALGCPAPGDFVAEDPGLFEATGFAHHPYSFFLSPDMSMSDPNFVPLADLKRLERGLDTIFSAYGVSRSLPLYLTEYGYATDPPNPYSGVSLSRQAAYIDQSAYLAWKDPRVRALSQFLLYDSPPDKAYRRGTPRYWSTFQTGLLFAGGTPKPSLSAYRLPIFIADPVLRHGRVFVWGRVRPARGAVEVALQWRSGSGRVSILRARSSRGVGPVLATAVQLPGPGQLRLVWRGYASRWVAIRG